MFHACDSSGEAVKTFIIMIVGITFSAFDLLHAGHVKMLEDAKMHCDYLIAGLQTDPTIDRPEKNKPVQTVVERYIQLRGCKYVDEIVPYATEEDLLDILKIFPINVRIIGDEYSDKKFTGRDFCEENGIQIFYNKRQHRFSSSLLRQEIASKHQVSVEYSSLDKILHDEYAVYHSTLLQQHQLSAILKDNLDKILESKDTCILCGTHAVFDISTSIDKRNHYREGVGQLCKECGLIYK